MEAENLLLEACYAMFLLGVIETSARTHVTIIDVFRSMTANVDFAVHLAGELVHIVDHPLFIPHLREGGFEPPTSGL